MTRAEKWWLRCCCGWMSRSGAWRSASLRRTSGSLCLSVGSGGRRVTRRSRRAPIGPARRPGVARIGWDASGVAARARGQGSAVAVGVGGRRSCRALARRLSCGDVFAESERVSAGQPGRHQVEQLAVMAVTVTEHQCQRARCPSCAVMVTGVLFERRRVQRVGAAVASSDRDAVSTQPHLASRCP
jgi:hypothetical protein